MPKELLTGIGRPAWALAWMVGGPGSRSAVAPAGWPSVGLCWKRLRMVNGISGSVFEVLLGNDQRGPNMVIINSFSIKIAIYFRSVNIFGLNINIFIEFFHALAAFHIFQHPRQRFDFTE